MLYEIFNSLRETLGQNLTDKTVATDLNGLVRREMAQTNREKGRAVEYLVE